MRPSVHHRFGLAAAIAACVGCFAGCFGGESLGDHKPAGSGGTGVSSTGGVNGLSGTSDTGGTSATVGSGGTFTTGGSGGTSMPGSGGDTFTTGSGGAAGTGGVSGSAGGVTGSAGSGPAQFCGTAASYAEPALRSDILIVIDRSSSMKDDSNETVCMGGCGPSSKFEVLSAALDQLVNETPSVNWGLAFYPTDDACGVTAGATVDVSPNAPPTIDSTLPTMMPGGGDAPTAAAIYAASAYLQSRLDTNPKYILLATDGRSGCATGDGESADVEAESAISSALSVGIPTFVVAIVPSSDTTATATLNQMAELGGQPAQGTASSFLTIADLGPSFAPMTSSAVSCDLYLPFPIGPDTMLQIEALASDGSVVAEIPQGSSNGWSFTSPNLDGVVLNGAACASTMDGGYAQFEMYYGCPGPPLLERARPVGDR